MRINFLELYSSMYKVAHRKVKGNMVFTVFDCLGKGGYKYLTLIASDKGVKKGAVYGWNDANRAKKYLDEKYDDYCDNLKRKEEYKAKAKEEAKDFADSLQIGDILISSWGYEAIWHDFYKVVDKKGQFVVLQEMNQNRTMEGCKYGYESHGIVSCGDTPKDEAPIRRKICNGYVKINSYAFAHRWDGRAREEANWH